ncbi:hypothetical protein [Hazenella coriacea]|uniref:Uncharacterized protein n=1 Tax=Hazenella coriacea TaxID=1179467 RepID=A0A4R3L055_9BACL|nr:hypothetical protein [Hazenella coriacea]TCS92574.1 hypothetical protein EDD58_11138 [Hazenella coriacea]
MGANLNQAVAKDGVIAYRDHADKSTFHYWPARIDAVLGETIKDFSVKYWGINSKPYYQQVGKKVESIVGAELSGRAAPDLTQGQREAIMGAIKERYNITPNLVPLTLEKGIRVQPVLAQGVQNNGYGSSSVFPDQFQLGNSFMYNVTSGNSLFAQLAGNRTEYVDGNANPSFGVNIYGTADFYGDPWIAEIECDLSQVWKYTRTQFETGVYGWMNLGAQLDKIAQSLVKENIINIRYIQGSGESEFGRQLLETTKTVFEAINNQIVKGEGMFKFEPNPTPQSPPPKDKGWSSKLLPWTVSLNLSYSSEVFNQQITYKQKVEFSNKVPLMLNTSMSLAVSCNKETNQYFQDFQDPYENCITPQKSEGLQKRLQVEAQAKSKKVAEYESLLLSGKLTINDYAKLLELLDTITLTEAKKIEEQTSRLRELEKMILS